MNIEEFIRLQSAVMPEAMTKLNARYQMLQAISQHAPIGRRMLAKELKVSERVCRTEVEVLDSLHLLVINKKGIQLSTDGEAVYRSFKNVMNTLNFESNLAYQLKQHYDLKDIVVVKGDADLDKNVQGDLSKSMAERLQTYFFDGAVISVAGGSTMATTGEYFKPFNGELLFVPARGGLGEEIKNQANYITSIIAAQTGGKHKLLYAPDSLSKESYGNLMGEPSVKEIMVLNEDSHFVIHGIGEAKTMARRRNASEAFIRKIDSAVGEAFGYYFDNNGKIIEKMRTIGLQLEDLKKKKCIFAVAGGKSKSEAVRAYLNIAPKETILFIDEAIAKYLIINI